MPSAIRGLVLGWVVGGVLLAGALSAAPASAQVFDEGPYTTDFVETATGVQWWRCDVNPDGSTSNCIIGEAEYAPAPAPGG